MQAQIWYHILEQNEQEAQGKEEPPDTEVKKRKVSIKYIKMPINLS